MDSAEIVAREGNWAVVQMPLRHFPALAIQGDTFHILTDNVRTALAACPEGAAGEELAYALSEMEIAIEWYADVLQKRGSELPWRPRTE